MFVRSQIFKKLVKEAYSKGGLDVFNAGEELIVGGAYWRIQVIKDKIPKRELAAIIEFAGKLPEKGQAFTATKEGNQGKIIEEIPEADGMWMGISRISMITSRGENVRLLQSTDRKIYMVYEHILSLIDRSQVDWQDGESEVEGPFLVPDKTIIWRNNVMRLKVFCREDEASKELIEYMEGRQGGIV